MNQLDITFDQAYRSLSRNKLVTDLENISEQMTQIQKMAKIIGVYRAARSKEPRLNTEEEQFRIPNIWQLRRQGDFIAGYPAFDRLCEEITSWLCGKFPLLEDPTFAQWTDNSDDCSVMYVVNPGIEAVYPKKREFAPSDRTKMIRHMSFHLQEKPAGILALKCACLRRVSNGQIKAF